MHRRQWLVGLGALAGATGFAGCTVHLPKPGEPELAHEVASESFVGEGFQPTVLVTGQVTNVGEVYVDWARLTARLVDGDGEPIDQRSTTLERIEREETQPFHFVFPVSAADVTAFEAVEIDVSYPGRES